MAIVKQYGLKGVGNDVQFGKGNGRFLFDTDHFEVRNLGDTAYVNLRVLDPVDAADAATKAYVDNVAQGLQVKEAVRVATNSLTTVDSNINGGSVTNDMTNLTYSSANDEWTLSGGVVDGITLADGDRVLIKDATGGDAVGNGIFDFALATGLLTRSADADNSGSSPNASTEIGGGTFALILEGLVNASAGYVCVSPTGTATLGTDDITFKQFSKSTGVTASDGLTQSGSHLTVRTDGSTIHISNDDLAVKSSSTQHQVLLSQGTGDAIWGALNLGEAAATTGSLPANRGGLGTDVSAFADDSIMLTDGSGGVTELAQGTANQVLRVDSNGVLGYGTIDLASTAAVSGVLDEANGGTGESTYAQYDLLMGDATNKLTKLTVGANNEVLRVSSAGVLEYGAIDLASGSAGITGVLDEANGGTGESTYAQGDLLVGDATNGLGKLSIGLSGQMLTVNSTATDVEWSTVSEISNLKAGRSVNVTTSSTNLGTALPPSTVLRVLVDVTSAYNAGASLSVGRTGAVDELALADEIDLQTAGIYQVDLRHLYGSSTQALVTVTGATAGACTVVLEYLAT